MAVEQQPEVDGLQKGSMGLLIGGAATLGILNGSSGAIDAAYDVAFNDPQADRTFTGSDIGPKTLAGISMGRLPFVGRHS